MAKDLTSNTMDARRAGGCDSGTARPQPTPLEQAATEQSKENK